MRGVGTVLALVILATVVATFARRWRIPAPSLLVVAGLTVALLPGTPQIGISPEIIGLVVLPPLLYASAEELSWRELRAVWKPVGILAIGLVLASAAAVGWVASLVTPLSWQMAFVLGAILASTDPVAVTALGRRLALPPRVQMLVQAESLFNDATSLVLYRVAVSVAVATAAVGWGSAGSEFVVLAGGGTLIGAAVAGVVALIRRRTEDPVLETVIALVTPVRRLRPRGGGAHLRSHLRGGRGRGPRRPGRPADQRPHPAPTARRLRHGGVPAGERGVLPHRPGPAGTGSGAGRGRPGLAAVRPRGGGHADRRTAAVAGAPVGRGPAQGRHPADELAGTARPDLGGHPGSGPPGRRPVHPRGHEERHRAGGPSPGPRPDHLRRGRHPRRPGFHARPGRAALRHRSGTRPHRARGSHPPAVTWPTPASGASTNSPTSKPYRTSSSNASAGASPPASTTPATDSPTTTRPRLRPSPPTSSTASCAAT